MTHQEDTSTPQPSAISALLGLEPVHVRVAENTELSVIEAAVTNGRAPMTIILTTSAALDMALQLIGASSRMTKRRLVAENYDGEA